MSENGAKELPISKELLEILRCPQAVQEKEKYGEDPGKLELVRNSWLVSEDSGYKYPIRDGIPIMLIDEGKKWKDTDIDSLPVPPPSAAPSSASATTTYNESTDNGMTPIKIAGIVAAVVFVFVLLRRRKK